VLAQVIAHSAGKSNLDRSEPVAKERPRNIHEPLGIDAIDVVAGTDHAQDEIALILCAPDPGHRTKRLPVRQGQYRLGGQRAKKLRLFVLDGPDEVGAVERDLFLVRGCVEKFLLNTVLFQERTAASELIVSI